MRRFARIIRSVRERLLEIVATCLVESGCLDMVKVVIRREYTLDIAVLPWNLELAYRAVNS